MEINFSYFMCNQLKTPALPFLKRKKPCLLIFTVIKSEMHIIHYIPLILSFNIFRE